VFDGDAYARDGFTRVVADAAAELRGVRVAAFVLAADVEAWRRSWQRVDLPSVQAYVVADGPPPDDASRAVDRYVALGLAALRATRATLALCLGGGPTVLEEARRAPRVTFAVVACDRRRADGSREASALLGPGLGLPNVRRLHHVGETPLEQDELGGAPLFVEATRHHRDGDVSDVSDGVMSQDAPVVHLVPWMDPVPCRPRPLLEARPVDGRLEKVPTTTTRMR